MKESSNQRRSINRLENKAIPHAAAGGRARTREEGRNVPRAQCVATTKQREQCKAMAVPGSTKCRMHGGLVTGAPVGNANAMKGGIYSRYRTQEEIEMQDDVRATIGGIDNEIEQAKFELIRLQRARDEAATNDHSGLELQKRHDREASEYGPGDEAVYERVDYSTKILACTRAIESLERTRAVLLQSAIERGEGGADDDIAGFGSGNVIVFNMPPGSTADDSARARAEMRRLHPDARDILTPDELGPENPIL